MNQPNKSADKTKAYTVASFYNNYLENIEKDTVYDIEYNLYKKIIVDYFQWLRDELLENAKQIHLPYRLGKVQIIKKRPKYYDKRSLRIDYKATKEHNKLILLDNAHSDFFKYRCAWDKQDILTKNKSKYQLVMTRANKRHLAQLIKQKLVDYEEGI